MTAGFTFTARCPTCTGPLTADPSTIGPNHEYGPSVVASCGCGAVWMLRATIAPAVVCGLCGAAYETPAGLAVHTGTKHQNRYEEDTVDPAEQPRPLRDWQHRAACLGMDPNLFIPPAEESVRPLGPTALELIARAKDVCAGCPVTADCLRDAETKTGWKDHSIRGGMTPGERFNARRRTRRAS